MHKCNNCDHEAKHADLPPARDLHARLEPGDTVTDVECPECSGLCFPIEADAPKPSLEERARLEREHADHLGTFARSSHHQQVYLEAVAEAERLEAGLSDEAGKMSLDEAIEAAGPEALMALFKVQAIYRQREADKDLPKAEVRVRNLTRAQAKRIADGLCCHVSWGEENIEPAINA